MKRPKGVSRRQLALSLERGARHQPVEKTREELLDALADLLLEALGEEEDEQSSEQRGANESEDYT